LYDNILIAIDGSNHSNLAEEAALNLAENYNDNPLVCCHVYAANMHRTRFEDMEPGLPDRYQEEKRLNDLRDTHEDIITEGMQLISDAYLYPIFSKADKKGIKYRGSTPEGRNYVELLKVIKKEKADLIIMGAQGHGKVDNDIMGSLTERTLFYTSKTDMLIIRKPWDFKGRPIIVGIDGSKNSYAALKKGVEISKMVKAPIEAVAVYDPFFHIDVFSTITDVLPDEAKERFNFEAQEKLHDEIIDKGLENLYKEGLERGVELAKSMGVEINSEVAKGKVYNQLYHHAALKGAGLLIIGRWGLHKEDESIIGSNTLNLARSSNTNVLIVSESDEPLDIPESSKNSERNALKWTPEAESLINKVPSFAQSMARRMVENSVIEKNESTVTQEHVEEIGNALGMNKNQPITENKPEIKLNNSEETISNLEEISEAQIIVFKKIKRMAPDFHKHILKSKIQNQVLKAGDKALVYEVLETIPPGTVRVTERTLVEFK
jgi:nucleotide-binding universal stress UspA family protein